MMTENELQEIRARYEATTPGKWVIGMGNDGWNWPVYRIHSMDRVNESQARRDGEFMEHAHNEDIPALLAEVRRLREENERLRYCGNCRHANHRLTNTDKFAHCEAYGHIVSTPCMSWEANDAKEVE